MQIKLTVILIWIWTMAWAGTIPYAATAVQNRCSNHGYSFQSCCMGEFQEAKKLKFDMASMNVIVFDDVHSFCLFHSSNLNLIVLGLTWSSIDCHYACQLNFKCVLTWFGKWSLIFSFLYSAWLVLLCINQIVLAEVSSSLGFMHWMKLELIQNIERYPFVGTIPCTEVKSHNWKLCLLPLLVD